MNTNLRIKLIGTLILISLLLSLPLQAESVIINIEREETISSSRILLGNIADLLGQDKELLKSLQGLDLGHAPRPGNSRKLSRSFVKLVLRNGGFKPENYNLKIPEMFTVRTASREIKTGDIEDFIRRFLTGKISQSGEKIEIRIINKPDRIIIPAKEYNLEIKETTHQKYRGNFSLPLIVRVNGEKYKQIYVGVEVKILRELYVAHRELNAGTSLQKEDFRLVTRGYTGNPERLITNWKASVVQGAELRYSLNKGQVLTRDLLEKPVLINWGDHVQARVEVGNIKITTAVKALGNGQRGEEIMVENTRTGARFRAEVISANRVRVIGN